MKSFLELIRNIYSIRKNSDSYFVSYKEERDFRKWFIEMLNEDIW